MIKGNTQQTARTTTVPAPVRGLNFKDSLASMRPTDALVLDNLVCRPSYLEVRKGWQNQVTGFGSNVQTLVSYIASDGTKKLFAAAGSGIYDVTSAGALGAASVTGLTSAYWSSTVIGNVGGNTLLMVNGTDTGQSYNGTTWSSWGITGIASTSLDHVMVWKRRVWAVEKNSFRAWYLATDAVTGAATSFDFKTIFQRGGKLVALLNWTVDGGTGVDDLLVAVTSEGEVALYQGTDPASAANFSLRGVYFIGKPVGRRFWTKFGGDLLILTVGGLVALSRFLQSAVLNQISVLTDQIQKLITSDALSYGSTQGWELTTYMEDNLLILQVPAGSVGSRYQYVMNVLTGAWSKIYLNKAITFVVHDGALYAGHSDRVSNSWTGGTDNGSPITYRVVPAFSYFGASTQNKRFTLGRVTFESDTVPQFLAKLLRDFDVAVSFPSQTAPSASGSLWDSAIWDSSIWGGSTSYYRKWFSLNGLTSAASVAVEGISIGTTSRIISLDYVYEPGGIL